jgi:hypothetical protein
MQEFLGLVCERTSEEQQAQHMPPLAYSTHFMHATPPCTQPAIAVVTHAQSSPRPRRQNWRHEAACRDLREPGLRVLREEREQLGWLEDLRAAPLQHLCRHLKQAVCGGRATRVAVSRLPGAAGSWQQARVRLRIGGWDGAICLLSLARLWLKLINPALPA